MRDIMDFRFGIYEKALPYSIDWTARFDLARKLGFNYVEMSIDESPERLARLDWTRGKRDELLKLSRDADFPIFSLCLSAHRKWPLGSADDSTRKRAFDILEKAIQLAVDLNVRIVQIMGYWVYYEPIEPDSEEKYLEGLRRGADLGEKYGVMLGIENIDGYTYVNSISKAMEYIDEIGSPWLKLYSDFANLAAYKLDVKNELIKGQGEYVAIHVKDSMPEEVRRIPFGEGMVDFKEAFDTLADIGYMGPFLLEMWNDDSPESADRIAGALQKTKEYLRQSRYFSK